jgi:hypothetical protein
VPPDAAADGAGADPDAAADVAPDAAADGDATDPDATDPDALGAEPVLELLLQPAMTVTAARPAAARPRTCLLSRRCIRTIWLPCRVRTCSSTHVAISALWIFHLVQRKLQVETARSQHPTRCVVSIGLATRAPAAVARTEWSALCEELSAS